MMTMMEIMTMTTTKTTKMMTKQAEYSSKLKNEGFMPRVTHIDPNKILKSIMAPHLLNYVR